MDHHVNSNSTGGANGGVSSPPQNDCDNGTLRPPQPRGRNNSTNKSKLLRSHAMREEASPPREPTPTPALSPSRLRGPPGAAAHRRLGASPASPRLVVSPSRASASPSSATLTPQAHRSLSQSPSGVAIENSSNSLDFREDSFEEDNNVYVNNSRRKNYYEGIVEEGGNNGCCMKCPRNSNFISCNSNINNNNNGVSLSVSRMGSRGSLRHQSSSQTSFESGYGFSPRLSRDNSTEIYTDTTGVNLVKFIRETLNKNMKDRQLMLKIEQELLALCECDDRTHFKFPAMSSYQRMLVHRVAAYFGLDHNIEPIGGKSVVVNKTRNTRIPEERFESYIRDDVGFTEEPRRSILKRDSNSVEDYGFGFKSPGDKQLSYESRRSKSLEEREEEYIRAKRRIFNGKESAEYASSEDMGWHERSWSSAEGDAAAAFRLQPPVDHHGRCGGRLLKVHSEETRDETLRPHVAKSYSFGGYGGAHSRHDLPHSNGPRLLTKQDSATSSSRLSPSSSGYKTQSQRSGSVTPSPTSISFSGDSLRQDSTTSVATNTSEQASPSGAEHQEVVWVQFNVSSAPKGKEVIDPNTGTTARNPDGSVYKFDPENVPPNVVVLSDSTVVEEETVSTTITSTSASAPTTSTADSPRPPGFSGGATTPTAAAANRRDFATTTVRRRTRRSCGSSVSSPPAAPAIFYAPPPQIEVGSTGGYVFPGQPQPQQQAYGYGYAVPPPPADYAVFSQMQEASAAAAVGHVEMSYYEAMANGTQVAYAAPPSQQWVHPAVYQQMQPRYSAPCVVYGAPPIHPTSDPIYATNPSPLYVTTAPPPPPPVYPSTNMMYGTPMYQSTPTAAAPVPPSTGYASHQPMYPPCAAVPPMQQQSYYAAQPEPQHQQPHHQHQQPHHQHQHQQQQQPQMGGGVGLLTQAFGQLSTAGGRDCCRPPARPFSRNGNGNGRRNGGGGGGGPSSSPSDSASPATVVSSTYAQVAGSQARTPTNTPPAFGYGGAMSYGPRNVNGNVRCNSTSNVVSTRSSTPAENGDRGGRFPSQNAVFMQQSPGGRYVQTPPGRGGHVRPQRQNSYPNDNGNGGQGRGRNNGRRQRKPHVSP